MDYLAFIAPVTSHIPDKGEAKVRYHGLYANAPRKEVHKPKEGEPKLIIVEAQDPRILRPASPKSRMPGRGWQG